MALLGLSHTADLEIHVTGWLGVESHEGSLPTAPSSPGCRRRWCSASTARKKRTPPALSPELEGCPGRQDPGRAPLRRRLRQARRRDPRRCRALATNGDRSLVAATVTNADAASPTRWRRSTHGDRDSACPCRRCPDGLKEQGDRAAGLPGVSGAQPDRTRRRSRIRHRVRPSANGSRTGLRKSGAPGPLLSLSSSFSWSGPA